MKEDRVTIYITNFNYGKYIKKSIESVLKQTYKKIEILIIDDGSSDKSRQIIEQYRKKENIKIVFQENKGLNVTNNIALKLSTSEYIMRLDADDMLDDNAVEIMMKKITGNPQLAAVFPDYYIVDEFDNVVSLVRRHDFKKVKLLDQPAHGACTLFRKKFLLKVGGYSELYRCQDGFDVWLKIFDKYKIENINLPLFYYRRHSSNLTKNENRIINTRYLIKKAKAQELQVHKKNNLLIIPIRSFEENIPLVLKKFANTSLIEIALKTAEDSENIKNIIVTTQNEKILDFLEKKKRKKALILDKRPEELAKINSRLEDTLAYLLKKYKKTIGVPDSITFAYVEYPLRTSMYIDKAINTLYLFKVDIVVGVREENSIFYRHKGDGLISVNNAEMLKLERDIIYRGCGGIRVVDYKYFKKHKTITGGQTGHIIMEEEASMNINSAVRWEILENIYKLKRKYAR